MDNKLFYKLFSKHLFLKYVSHCYALLLVLDGYFSHYIPDLVKETQQHDANYFLSATLSITSNQPLDTGVFGSL